jgi:hypothetical protein
MTVRRRRARSAGRQELPDGPAKADTLDQLQELVDLTQDDNVDGG